MSDSIKIVFLGTSASVPTKERNLSSIALRYGGEWLLFDAPEGTQRQMMKARTSYLKINHLFISHFHADHFLGLAGLLATMNIHGRDWPLTIYGPKGIAQAVRTSLDLAMLAPGFEIRCVQARKGTVLEHEKFSIEAVPLDHEVECFGYVFRENDKPGEFNRAKALELGIPIGPMFSELQKGRKVKVDGRTIKPEDVIDRSKGRAGRKVAIIFDTLPSRDYYKAVEGADILIHESSFLEDMKARAKETMHSTALDAAKVAKETGCKKLVLFHLSARHKEDERFENEARSEFGNVVVAKDLLEIDL
ncbi:MAG TPA: ribonuclease Z [Candidatus Diapherotrites archaeon]|uniref:Ribonuclease Z n=1 Tax=Candidatus Iainarchaeum sp. TaxID=3101447 RepID=A0A7J4J1W7_9ARCH|nr:ribonuclease Z [Candidatus Diapherotrites archaeon]